MVYTRDEENELTATGCEQTSPGLCGTGDDGMSVVVKPIYWIYTLPIAVPVKEATEWYLLGRNGR